MKVHAQTLQQLIAPLKGVAADKVLILTHDNALITCAVSSAMRVVVSSKIVEGDGIDRYVPKKMFEGIVKAIDGSEEVTFEQWSDERPANRAANVVLVNDKGEEVDKVIIEQKLRLKWKENGRSRQATFKTPQDDRPDWLVPSIAESEPINLPAMMKDIIKAVAFAAANNDHRPVLYGLHFKTTGGHLIIQAADGVRAGQYTIESDLDLDSVVIPVDTLMQLASVLEDTDDDLKLYMGDRAAQFVVNRPGYTILFQAQLIKVDFINLENILKQVFESPRQIRTFDTRALRGRIAYAHTMTRDYGHQVTLACDDDGVTITSNDNELGSTKSYVEHKVAAPAKAENPLPIHVNAQMFEEALACAPDDTVSIVFPDDPTRPIAIQADDAKWISVQMPMVVRA